MGGGGVPCLRGMGVASSEARSSLVNRMTDTCKNITFRYTSYAVGKNVLTIVIDGSKMGGGARDARPLRFNFVHFHLNWKK